MHPAPTWRSTPTRSKGRTRSVAEGEGLGDGTTTGRILARALAFKEKLRAGGTVIGAWLSISDPAVAEVFGRAGFDFVIIDMEHGGEVADLQVLKHVLIALEAG